jgi:heme/copper-type cytochrome/quinol oxidase subunit 3
MHLTWGALALAASLMGSTVAKRFCIGSGVFYLTLASLGMVLGNSLMNRAWYLGPMLLHTGDHIFHLVLGSVFLSVGLLSGRSLSFRQVQQARS